MATSKLISSTSASSRNSDLRRNSLTNPEFYNFHGNHNDKPDLDGGFLRNAYGGPSKVEIQSAAPAVAESSMLSTEITLLDAAGAIAPITGSGSSSSPPVRKKTVDDIWREIVAGKAKANEPMPPRKVECKEEAMEEMMTLEDFLVKAGAVDESAVSGAVVEGEVKLEPLSGAGPSGGMFSFDNSYVPRQGSVDSAMMSYGSLGGGIGGGRGKRRTSSLLEPIDKAAAQRQRRMIKNRESAARSRERKQAYQVELESMAVRLEEENEQLLKEKAARMKERCKLVCL
ncbi:OLC1v1017700C1 [Oldenlandia corymbosa var. corymbosa]|uniref:OLC1v1017700C1 n=1 Tax=Oldenlandia corymbosa var. corymbosa TaxID=529605 RepID=A0AAV1EA02_OLDCO|nr:OLC1v1017700C1 [Oldenlandia corymbosa var. corymbosa]